MGLKHGGREPPVEHDRWGAGGWGGSLVEDRDPRTQGIYLALVEAVH